MFQVDENWCWLIRELTLNRIKCEDTVSLSGLIPILTVAVVTFLKEGHDPSIWIDLIMESLKKTNEPADIVLLMLTQCLPKCSTLYIESILNVCKYNFKRLFHWYGLYIYRVRFSI